MKVAKELLTVALCGFMLFGAILCGAAQTKLNFDGQIIDQNKATVSKAEITLIDEASQSFTTKTDNQGKFHFANLNAGTYVVTVYAESFDILKADLKLETSLQQPLVYTLNATVKEEITVHGNDPNMANTETAINGNAIVLNEEDLAGLPEDPDDLLAALKDMAGPANGVDDASVYVDGFLERGRIPPREAILRVTINANPYSPEFSEPGFSRIQIITKPGTDIFHASFGVRFNNQDLDARNPFVAVKAPYMLQNYSGTLAGPIIKGKAAFFLDVERNEVNDNSFINARLIDPTTLIVSPFTATVLSPVRLTTFNIRNDFMLSKNNTLMVGYRYLDQTRDNTGAGGFALPEHTANSETTDNQLRISDTDIISPTKLNEFRVQLDKQTLNQQANSTEPQISVQQAFTTGGDQGALFNSRLSNSLDLNDNFSFVHGKHSMKAGVQININNVSDINRGNFGGSFTFLNLQDYAAAINGDPNVRALQFSQISGIPTADATLWRFGWFAMDDWKIKPNLTISAGLRHEFQTHLPDKLNLAPRLAIAWSPDSRPGGPAKTSIRTGFGLFYNQLSEGAILAVDRADGFHQINTVIPCASFPNPSITDPATCPDELLQFIHPQPTAFPTVREFQTALRMPYTIQWNVGVDRNLPHGFFLSTTFTRIKGVHLFHSIDLNAPDPVSGVVPFPDQGPILQVQSDANFIRNMLTLNLRRQLSKYFSINVNYILGKSMSDYGGGGFNGSGVSGIFSLPTNQLNPEADWGRVDGDARHYVVITGQVNLPRGIRLNPFIRYQSSTPFNIITGRDNNGDTIINDRPAFATAATLPANLIVTQWGTFDINPVAGEIIIPRNFGIAPGHFSVDLSMSKVFGWGEPRHGGWQAPPDSGGGDQGQQGGGRTPGGRGAGGGGRGGGGGGGRGGGGRAGGATDTSRRYNLTFTVQARNIFNITQLGAPNGVLPANLTTETLEQSLFGKINSASNPRNVQVSLRFNW